MARPKKGEPNKSEFIRANAELSIADLVAKGKEAGLAIDPTLVYKVRAAAAKKKPAAEGAAKAAPAKKAAKKAAPKKAAKAPAKKPAPKAKPAAMSASAFIRSLPTTLTAKEVVAKGKEKGLKFSEPLVYIVRGRAKAKKAGGKAPAAAAPTAPARAVVKRAGRPAAAPKAVPGSHAITFRKLVLELGVAASKALLAEVEHKLAALIAG